MQTLKTQTSKLPSLSSSSPSPLIRLATTKGILSSPPNQQILKPTSSSRYLSTSPPNRLNNTTNMALFPRLHTEYAPLFRLLDDYDAHRSDRTGEISAFSPRFDVRETKDSYMLDGELPGIEQKDINIEFTDPHTLVINGRTERSYTEGAPPGRRIEAGSRRQPTVEDESGGKSRPKEAGDSRYWVSERSVGEFHRTFNFPTRVNQDGVKASLKHGILSVSVPKTTAPQTRKITIE